jgi:hypothetical protein
MTANIYDQHDAAFAQVSAFVILDKGERVATVALKMPPRGRGEGRLWAYVHWIGSPMARGFASGYGYDKASAAVNAAGARIPDDIRGTDTTPRRAGFIDALGHDRGPRWAAELEAAGFTVLQAV